MYINDKVLSQQVDHSCLSPFHGPTEPVLTGSGGVINLERGQGRSVCVQASVHPSSSSSPPSFCADGLCAAGLKHRGTEDYCN